MIIVSFSGRGHGFNANVIEQVILFEDVDEFEIALEDCEGDTEEEKIKDLAIPGLTFDGKHDTDTAVSFTSLPLGDSLVRLG